MSAVLYNASSQSVAREVLLPNNFSVVKGFLDRETADVLATFLRDHECLMRPDTQVANSPAIYNALPLVKLLCAQTQAMSEIVGAQVLPTYTYARVYKKGAVLHPHTDRGACEISATVNLSGSHAWGIFIKDRSGLPVCVEQSTGDALVYLGCDAEHWRDEFLGDECVQVFLHYVLADGQNARLFFDRTR